jgi:hypothetical protein
LPKAGPGQFLQVQFSTRADMDAQELGVVLTDATRSTPYREDVTPSLAWQTLRALCLPPHAQERLFKLSFWFSHNPEGGATQRTYLDDVRIVAVDKCD